MTKAPNRYTLRVRRGTQRQVAAGHYFPVIRLTLYDGAVIVRDEEYIHPVPFADEAEARAAARLWAAPVDQIVATTPGLSLVEAQ